MWNVCCFRNPKKPTDCCGSFFVAGDVRYGKESLLWWGCPGIALMIKYRKLCWTGSQKLHRICFPLPGAHVFYKTLSFTNQVLWQDLLVSILAWGREPPINLLLILVSLRAVGSWWPCWMVLSLEHNLEHSYVPVEHYPLVGLLVSHNTAVLACPLPWGFLSFSPLSGQFKHCNFNYHRPSLSLNF